MAVQRCAFAGAALALLAAALFCANPASASTRNILQTITEFPPGCKCERTLQYSPWRLEYDLMASTPVFGFKRHCFTIKRASCDARSTCCDASLGVYKVELAIEPGCKASARRLTLNGDMYGTWEFNPGLGLLRVTRLNLTQATAPGTQICVFLKTDSSCTELGQLCKGSNSQCQYAIFNANRTCCPVGYAGLPPPPPPHFPVVPAFGRPAPPSPYMPPPPPRSDFPNCVCDRNAAGSRLYLKPRVEVTPIEKNLTKICFRVGAHGVCARPDSDCCTFDLHKVELEADPACAPALAYSTVNGAYRTRFFQFTPYPVIKITGIDKPFAAAAANETEVCVVMKPQCNTLKALGAFHDGTITVAVANKPGSKPATCCPLFYAQ